ncbi:MAG: hypothetical protein U1B83_08845, partial [Candidatus Cloacimonadaceae bacterium]|nr:hypothetical protein [Candidatus Cloacimonadaceae bacterium]
TLYDFLAHRALEFYINDESGLTLPPEEFVISDSLYFQPVEGFAEMVITSPDSLSLKYQAALLYQDLIRFHLFDKDVSALMEVNLDRLEFFYQNARLSNAEKHYEAALRLEMLQYAANPVSALAAFKLATLYNNRAGKYNPELSEDYRWHFKIAAEICDHAEKAFPRSIGGQSCATLSSQIKHPVLQITSEQYVQPNMPVKVLLELKNLGGVEIKIYRIPHSTGAEDYNPDESWQRDNYKKVRELSRKKPLWSQSFSFENQGDFRSHSFELALTSLPIGNYIIIGSSAYGDSLKPSTTVGYSIFSSTNNSYVTPNRSDGSMMILNRSSGLPIKDAQLRIFHREWERKKSVYTHKQVWSGTSDAEGIIKVPTDLAYNSGKVLITSGADTLQIFNHYFYDYGDRRYKTNRCLLFTDRSIYRPGQTIHVKGLLYESDGEKIYNLMPNTSVTAYFYDSNYQLVASQNLK